METSSEAPKEKPESLWKEHPGFYQFHVTMSSIDTTTKLEYADEDYKTVYMEELEKRKKAYGVCEECNKPGTGWKWCQTCNAKRFEENFKNWTSGNKDIDEFIQQSQLNAVYQSKCLEWIPFEKFQNVTYIARGGFGKVYSADWPEGYIGNWNIENQEWERYNKGEKFALKSLDNSSDIDTDFLNKINSQHQTYLPDVVQCYGITQDPDTKDYVLVLKYCGAGNLRNNLNRIDFTDKIDHLPLIARGILGIHSAGKVHKNLHSGNIVYYGPYISDLGMCQPANNKQQQAEKEGTYGVLPYMAPEVLCGHQYTKASDIYSFGIVMNEYMSGETPYNNISHDHILAVKICQGFRPKISDDTPKLLADLIIRCWDAKPDNRPTAKELFQILRKLFHEKENNKESEINSQIKECIKIKRNKFKGKSKQNRPKRIQPHPQAIYTSRPLNFNNLPEPVNSSDLPSFQLNPDAISSTSENPTSECLDAQLNELKIN